jgi:hypothetical protein
MNRLEALALCMTLGTIFLPGCSGRSTADSPGNDGRDGTAATAGAGASGGSQTNSGPVGAGAASGTGGGIPPVSVECQSADDCGQGQICCSETMKIGTVCQADPCGTTLLGYPLQFCASDGECITAGQTCVATMVAGSTLQICRPGMTTAGMGGAPSAGGTAGASGSSNPDELPGAAGAADAAGGASGAGG